jgi:hypothetical protein
MYHSDFPSELLYALSMSPLFTTLSHVNPIDIGTFRPIVRQRLGKQARNKYATNNRGRRVLGNESVFYWSASRLYK